MSKNLLTVLAITILSQLALANIEISCGTSANEDGEVENEVVSISAESWIEGTSGQDFDLYIDGQEIKGATVEGESSSSSGLRISIPGGAKLQVAPWDGINTTARIKTKSDRNLQCAIIEM
jgi:hypothetical protein